MSQSRRPNSQNSKSIVMQTTIKKSQTITSLKCQLQQQRQNRWTQINQELYDFLSLNNLESHYNKIADSCDSSLSKLLKKSAKEIKDLPLGHQIKLDKIIQAHKKQVPQQRKTEIANTQFTTQECCWICFSLVHQGLECYGKTVCSEKCKRIYLNEIQVECHRCHKIKPKYEAINSYGEWYCQQSCVYSDEELMMLLMTNQLKN